MKTFTVIYYEEPSRGPGDYLRATVVAEDVNAAFEKFREEHPVAGDAEPTDDSELDESELPESVKIVCAIAGDLDVHWNYD